MARPVRTIACVALWALVAPLAAQEPAPPNPLARPPAWVGEWKGEQVALELRAEAGAAKGQLSVGGKAYPLQAKPKEGQPNRLEGSFTVDGNAFACSLELQGDVLALTSDGATHRLERARPPAPANPLAKPPAPNPLGTPPTGQPPQGEPPQGQPPQGAGPLGDAWAGEAQRRTNAGGAWSCEIPAGYTVTNEVGSGLLVNPGVNMQPGTIPEALLACELGELSPEEAKQPPEQLLRAVVPALQQMLQGQGISVPRPSEPVLVQVGGLPAGVYQWEAQGAGNQAPLTVWMGVVVRAPRYVLVLGVMQKGKEAAFLPKMKRLFATTQLAAGGGPLPGGQPGQPGMGGGEDDGEDDEGN